MTDSEKNLIIDLASKVFEYGKKIDFQERIIEVKDGQIDGLNKHLDEYAKKSRDDEKEFCEIRENYKFLYKKANQLSRNSPDSICRRGLVDVLYKLRKGEVEVVFDKKGDKKC